jgi:methylenetetrahydrofolate--tRNA-(uracil-5-)-methyltransferase
LHFSISKNILVKSFSMGTQTPDLAVIGGGLAGSEAAYQAASRGKIVWLYEMRPGVQTGAHVSGNLGELVCSNSLGSRLVDRASGLLKKEICVMGSLLIDCAEHTAIPAGDSLSVDRSKFSKLVTDTLENHPNIRIIREEIQNIPAGLCIITSGPLTSPLLSKSIQALTGHEQLFFYDAIAPIVHRDSIDMSIAFQASRYQTKQDEPGDYINCPFSRDEYRQFIHALLAAKRIPLKHFEADMEMGVSAGISHYFEGCLPVEILASRGEDALAYGPLRPTGLRDPRTGKRPYAILQLRQDNLAGDLFNLVGFQTNLTFSEQEKVFRLIPGLKDCEFERYGQLHRNTFLFSPNILKPSLQTIFRDDLFIAGQITGIEGYAGNIASGLLAGINAVRYLDGKQLWELPETTMLGALCHYITHASPRDFQPMKANMGLLPHLDGAHQKGWSGRRERAQLFSARALAELSVFLDRNP